MPINIVRAICKSTHCIFFIVLHNLIVNIWQTIIKFAGCVLCWCSCFIFQFTSDKCVKRNTLCIAFIDWLWVIILHAKNGNYYRWTNSRSSNTPSKRIKSTKRDRNARRNWIWEGKKRSSMHEHTLWTWAQNTVWKLELKKRIQHIIYAFISLWLGRVSEYEYKCARTHSSKIICYLSHKLIRILPLQLSRLQVASHSAYGKNS